MKCEVKYNWNMGMGNLCLIMVGHLWLIMVGAFRVWVWLKWWGSYEKVSCCFVWKYVIKMLVFRGVPFPIIA